MPRGVRWDPNVKAQFLALVHTGAQIGPTAQRLGIPDGTAWDWFGKFEGKKGDAYDLILAQILGANLRACLTHATVLGDEDYIRDRRNNVSSLALSYGILADKAVRVLEGRPTQPEPGPGSDLDGPAAAEDVPPGA